MLVSVVVPVLAGDEALAQVLQQLPPQDDVEIIVSIAGDGDTYALRAARPDVLWVDTTAGRGPQLNAGAARARGRWLWFLHADSQLPDGWLDSFRLLDQSGIAVGGSFAFRLDSDQWQARIIETGVRWRVRLFNLPYGDQGIFVRRSVFDRMGGFANIALMEDVEFVRRLKAQGELRHLRLQVVTSARRWQRDGWWRRSALNLAFLTLYSVGVSPDWLSRRYHRT
jgi:rSAM/selenodomain-associated transferase 2